ncbi:MAG: LON peptidase substrate-binding domain-containing protein [Armatimonadetes bacterium]|nr:LON peptidase substrate-binding domain-containing protein [Armatimonadota bacterium]
MPARLQNLPLFPLHVVLYPGGTLPLRIFESRYRQMLADCLGGDRIFGVCLIRRGEEVGESAEPCKIGTTAEILQVQPLGEHRFYLLAIGQERFRIRGITRQQPYMVGEVELLPEPAASASALERIPEFRQQLERYIRLLAELLDQEAGELSLPEDPVRVVYLAASLLQVSLAEKQALLELLSTDERLERAERHLHRLIEKAIALCERRRQGVATPFDAHKALRRYSPN